VIQAKVTFFQRARRLALVRLLAFGVVLLAAYIGLQLLPLVLPVAFRHAFLDQVRVGSAIVLSAAMLALYVGLVRLLEGRPCDELAVRAAAPLAALGVALGAGLFVLTILLLRASHAATWGGSAGSSGLAQAGALALASAVGEELIFRGGLFRILEESLGSALAMTLSGALFGLLHALNPGATLVSSTAIALEAGVLLAATYALTRSLWAPIGLHFGWNFTEGGVFGAAVSGGQAHGLFKVALAGPPWLTGGAFGPEASVVAVGVSLAASALLIALAVRAGRWRRLRFRMTLD